MVWFILFLMSFKWLFLCLTSYKTLFMEPWQSYSVSKLALLSNYRYNYFYGLFSILFSSETKRNHPYRVLPIWQLLSFCISIAFKTELIFTLPRKWNFWNTGNWYLDTSKYHNEHLRSRLFLISIKVLINSAHLRSRLVSNYLLQTIIFELVE